MYSDPNVAKLAGEIEFWHTLAWVLGSLLALLVVVPPLAAVVARGLYSHSEAVRVWARAFSAWARVFGAAARSYRRTFDKTMQETA